MENLIVQLARYIIIILFALYTFYCFRAFSSRNRERQERVFIKQRTLIILIHLICSGILLLEYKSLKIVFLYVIQLVFFLVCIKMYQTFYKGLSKLVLNNMLMCIMIGFIMLGRLSYDYAIRQFMMVAVGCGLCLLVPYLIQRLKVLERLGWQYAICGIGFLLLVFVIGVEKHGSRNWIRLAGIEVQPSEFVKIIFVFFLAALLTKSKDFKKIIYITAVAGAHVLILVAEKDLGAALIYFVTYLMVLYIATTKKRYLFTGLAGGTAAAIVAYKAFAHVRVRVTAWMDPWKVAANQGYQITQSLFAIGTGSWFGMGLGQGLPRSVPVVESDFVFSAICEELGVIFGICLILVYLSSYIMFVNIAMKMQKEFYKLTAFGLSVVYIFQVLLCIGGVTKFIPSTGVTLPLISYGGSSILSTILIYSIIQGMYVLNGKEETEFEEGQERAETAKKARKIKA